MHTRNDPDRPNPDALLASIQRSEEAKLRGTLKIFFGMCPGVGKTYAMLQAAQALKAKNVAVAIGIVETHGREETEALLAGLSVVPRLQINYKGKALSDFDLDAALAARPAYVLVDELAHTNAEGMRHVKAVPGRAGTARQWDKRTDDAQCAARGKPCGLRTADHRGHGA